MISELTSAGYRKLACIMGMLVITGTAVAASILLSTGPHTQTARWLALFAMLALTGISIFGWGLAGLAARQARHDDEQLPLPLHPEHDMQKQMLELESRLEHAPIALFALDTINGEKTVRTLNGNARRLTAPGRVVEVRYLYEQIMQQALGSRSMINYETEQGQERALLATSSISLHGQTQLVIALMPLESELQIEAQQAWQKLIRVLTHEIMNSLTPVASLSSTAYDMLADLDGQIPEQSAADLSLALDAIGRRAHGLVEFVNSYRSLTRIPPAQTEKVQLQALLARLSSLLAPHWEARSGQLSVTVEPANLEAMLDPAQLEQALINLIKNAEEATMGSKHPQLHIHAKLGRGARLRIEVSDNGPGVPEDMVAHIFTPFFSTKEHGSGIGLAMVRQLMQGNGGTVRYANTVGGGARFIISL